MPGPNFNPSPFSIHLTTSPAQWLNLRQSSLGGSDAASVLGISPWQTPFGLWTEKTGAAPVDDISDSKRVRAGNMSEPVIRAEFAHRHPELGVYSGDYYFSGRPDAGVPDSFGNVIRATLVSADRPWQSANLDGVVVPAIPDDAMNPDPAVLEIKTAHMPSAKEWGPSGSGAAGVPDHYLAQVYHYLAVTGWSHAWVAVWIDGMDYRDYYVERDETIISDLIAAEAEFWEHVRTMDPPLASSPDDGQALARTFAEPAKELKRLPSPSEESALRELLESYEALKAAAAKAKDAADSVGNQIRQIIGEAKGVELTDGSRVTWTRSSRKKVDAKAMETEDPELVKAYETLKAAHTQLTTVNGALRVKLTEEKPLG